MAMKEKHVRQKSREEGPGLEKQCYYLGSECGTMCEVKHGSKGC